MSKAISHSGSPERLRGPVLLVVALVVAGSLWPQHVVGGTIRNGTVWRDAAGNEIWCNGGHILEEDGVFHWVGYDTGPGRWPWKINLYSSKDLAVWQHRGAIIQREGGFADLGWAGRPGLLHCQASGRYVIVFEADSPGKWGRHKVGFAVSDRIDGPYEMVRLESPRRNSTA